MLGKPDFVSGLLLTGKRAASLTEVADALCLYGSDRMELRCEAARQVKAGRVKKGIVDGVVLYSEAGEDVQEKHEGKVEMAPNPRPSTNTVLLAVSEEWSSAKAIGEKMSVGGSLIGPALGALLRDGRVEKKVDEHGKFYRLAPVVSSAQPPAQPPVERSKLKPLPKCLTSKHTISVEWDDTGVAASISVGGETGARILGEVLSSIRHLGLRLNGGMNGNPDREK